MHFGGKWSPSQNESTREGTHCSFLEHSERKDGSLEGQDFHALGDQPGTLCAPYVTSLSHLGELLGHCSDHIIHLFKNFYSPPVNNILKTLDEYLPHDPH